MKPVPHIAARDIKDMADLELRIQTLAAAAGGGECLLIAGSGSKPAGCFSDSMQVFQGPDLRCCLDRGILLSFFKRKEKKRKKVYIPSFVWNSQLTIKQLTVS